MNTIKHLDFTRDFLLRAREKDISEPVKKIVSHLKLAEKFILPEGGVLIDDKQLRAIDDKLPISLPFKVTVLEWPGKGSNKKNILLLRELADDIELTPLEYNGKTKQWGWNPPIFLNRFNYLEREANGRVAYFMRYGTNEEKLWGDATQVYFPFLYSFLSFINALSCRNVYQERSLPGAVRKARKSPIPYDEYKILTFSAGNGQPRGIGNSSEEGRLHARARKHIRRGHIVRGKFGPYWRNSHTVCADSEFEIKKSYKVKV